MTSEVPEPRQGELSTDSFVLSEDGHPDLFIDIHDGLEPVPVDPEVGLDAVEDDDGDLFAEADKAGGVS